MQTTGSLATKENAMRAAEAKRGSKRSKSAGPERKKNSAAENVVMEEEKEGYGFCSIEELLRDNGLWGYLCIRPTFDPFLWVPSKNLHLHHWGI